MFGIFNSSKTKRERDRAIREAAANSFTALLWERNYSELLIKYNDLIDSINIKGSEEIINKAYIQPQGIQISQDDLKTLIQLCHPGKHNGKESAVEITKKLLLLRD